MILKKRIWNYVAEYENTDDSYASKMGDFYSRELKYLMENGYHFVKEGDIWHAIR